MADAYQAELVVNASRVFRGTPSAPGRTVTLIEDPSSTVPGAAYLLEGSTEQQQETLKVCWV